MNSFDNTYNEALDELEEGKLKSLATAGLIGLGALGGGQNAQAADTAHQSIEQSDQESKKDIKLTPRQQKRKIAMLRELKMLASQADSQRQMDAIMDKIQKVLNNEYVI